MRYLFGDCVLDTQRYEFHRAGAPVALRPKVFHLLVYLLAHRDRVVPRQELIEQVWPGQWMSAITLDDCLAAARRAVGDSGQAQRIIQTKHRHGYLFVAPVTMADASAPPAAPCAPQTSGAASSPPVELPSVPPTEAAASRADGEYKLVTILCGALAEAPALAARLGPERWYRLLQTVVGLAREVLHHYAGTLTLATGDGFTAVFGAPMAQEDHARRAVLAALELRQGVQDAPALHAQLAGSGLALGMGLHSGLVVFGGLGQGLPWLAAVVGTPLHVATRLQQRAAPGTILLSAATYQFVHTEVRATPCGTLDMDGPPAPVSVYAVQGLLRRHAGVAGRGPRVVSPFVGRERELAVLQDHLAAAMAGQGQVVSLIGEPGMGKSRLLAEFCRTVAGTQVTVYVGQCLSYGQSTPYLPVRALLQQVCGLVEGDESAVHTAAVQHRLHASGITAAEDVALLYQILDLPGGRAGLEGRSPEVRQARTFALLRHLVLHAAQQQPLVLVVENLHWSDPTSAAWLTSLAERLSGGGGTPPGDLSAGVSARLGGTRHGDAGRRAALAHPGEPDHRPGGARPGIPP